MSMENYCVVEYTTDGKFCAVISGMGKNKGKWESTHSRSAAYRYAKVMRKSCAENKDKTYKVEATGTTSN